MAKETVVLKKAVINGHTRVISGPNLSDVEVATMVRMLQRSAFNHEFICELARDRIMYLTQENERLQAMLDQANPPVGF